MRGLRAALPGQANNSSYLQTAEPDTGAQLAMVDFPGVAVGDHEGLKDLRVHLVLNGAYEMDCLYNQLRFFERVGIGDLIISHFKEVVRPEKLWNLALGKRFSIGFLSGGQNVPGEFVEATSGLLFSAQNLP